MKLTSMKKGMRALGFFAFLLLLTGLSGLKSAHADAATSPIKVAVDTRWITFSVDPIIDKGTTLVQMRPLFESMGISLKWDPQSRVITGQKDEMYFTLKVNSIKGMLNGKEITLDQPAQIVQGNTLVPLRFVSEATGGLVAWDPKNREITVFTDQMLKQLGLSKEEAEQILAQSGTATIDSSKTTTNTEPGEKNRNLAEGKANLNDLQGMYVGFRPDISGYECEGACWDYYTFLPDHRIVVGEPTQGGPETIDCSKQQCSTYSIQNNQLILNNGESYSIRVGNGILTIDDVELTAVKPVPANFKLDGSYVYRGYTGMAGVNASSSAWEEWITFKPDGTFTSENLTMGSTNTGSTTTNSSSGSSSNGIYKITGNTISLVFSNGDSARYVFFIHNGKDGKPNPLDIQIGSRNFYVDQDA